MRAAGAVGPAGLLAENGLRGDKRDGRRITIWIVSE